VFQKKKHPLILSAISHLRQQNIRIKGSLKSSSLPLFSCFHCRWGVFAISSNHAKWIRFSISKLMKL